MLADYFADNDRKHNPFGVLMGVTMLASTTRGGMLTHEPGARLAARRRAARRSA